MGESAVICYNKGEGCSGIGAGMYRRSKHTDIGVRQHNVTNCRDGYSRNKYQSGTPYWRRSPLCEPLSYQPVAYMTQCYDHLANLDLADSSKVGEELQIDVLIGSDHYWQLVTGQIIQGDSGPTAIHTHLGWGLVCCSEMNNSYPSHSMLIQSPDSPHLDNLLMKFWDSKSLGIKADKSSIYEFKNSVPYHGARTGHSCPVTST